MNFEIASTLWRYERDTGILYWLVDNNPRRPVGKPVSLRTDGAYVQVMHDGAGYKVHRIAWLLETGAWPKDEIDHRDGNRANNRWDNLRDVPHCINQLNQKHHRLGCQKADWRRDHRRDIGSVQT